MFYIRKHKYISYLNLIETILSLFLIERKNNNFKLKKCSKYNMIRIYSCLLNCDTITVVLKERGKNYGKHYKN